MCVYSAMQRPSYHLHMVGLYATQTKSMDILFKLTFKEKQLSGCMEMGSREDVLEKYKVHLVNQCMDPAFKEGLMALRGKTLGCWCKPESCHGDIIKQVIETLKEQH